MDDTLRILILQTPITSEHVAAITHHQRQLPGFFVEICQSLLNGGSAQLPHSHSR
jgi:hypothetical protein